MARLALLLAASVTLCSVGGARIPHRRPKSSKLASCGMRGAAAAGNETGISIINGQPAAEGVWRWQIGLQRSTNPTARPWCGGSLITPEWVMTAAHCVHQWSFFFDAIAGDTAPRNPESQQQRRKVVQVIRHPLYESASKGWDFALLRLETPMEMTEHVGTVCLPAEGADVPPATSCWVTGWGTTQGGNDRNLLQEVSVDTMSNADCVGTRSDYNESQITPQMLCAQGRTADGLITDACTGDSGGPFVCEASGTWTVYGATSWGIGCAGERHPGVWARIHSVLGWIDEMLADNTGTPTIPPGQCPFDTFRPNPDRDGQCQCHRYHFCSLNGVDANCPTSEGPGGAGGIRFLQTCKECKCYADTAE